MFTQKINPINYISYKTFHQNPVKSLSFGGKINSAQTRQTMELAEKYIKRFSLEANQYKAEGNSILQPSQIPLDTLQSIAEKELLKMQKFPAGHRLLIVTGRIGGGKTTFVKQNNLQELFYAPDADEIKSQLPGYNERGAGYVHEASWTINATNLSEALKRGIDTIVQTATTIDNLDDIIDEARDYNYQDIIMIHIDTDENIAIERALKRGEMTGRQVDPDVIKERKYIDSIVSTYKTPLRGLSQLIVYNNNGNSPVKVEDVNLLTPPAELTYVTDFHE